MADQEQPGFLRIPIEWYFPEGLVSRYAANFVVQRGQNEFILSFFEVYPPIVLGEPEEQKAALDHLESVRAECVARIIVAPQQLLALADLLQDQIDKHSLRPEQE